MNMPEIDSKYKTICGVYAMLPMIYNFFVVTTESPMNEKIDIFALKWYLTFYCFDRMCLYSNSMYTPFSSGSH